MDAMVRRFGGKIVSITPPAKTKPTKAEMAEITKRVKVYSRNLLPGAGIANAEEAFKTFILGRAGVKDVKDIAKQDWESALDSLDALHKSGGIDAVVQAVVDAGAVQEAIAA